MSQQPAGSEFPQYAVDGPGAAEYAVIVLDPRVGISDESTVIGPLSYDRALAAIEDICRGRKPEIFKIDQAVDLVLKVSPQEFIIYRAEGWTGPRKIRITVGEIIR